MSDINPTKTFEELSQQLIPEDVLVVEKLSLPTNTTRCIREIAFLEKKFLCLVNDYSIEVFCNEKTKYVFGKLLKFPFYIPEITVIDTDLRGKSWVFQTENNSHSIDHDGKVSLNITWSPQLNLIDLVELIQAGLINKKLLDK